jgi:hypothetical protein
MTAIVVATQGYGLADRTKTCARASTKAKARAFRTTAHDFAALRGRSRALSQNLRSPACDLDVTDGRSELSGHDLGLAGKG